MNGNHTLNFVPDDGYTESGFIKAIPGLHGELRFDFRPFLVEERSKLLRELENLAQEKQDAIVAKTFVERLKNWDLKDRDGNAVRVSLGAARRLKPQLFYRLWAILLGTEASDADPEWETQHILEEAENEIEAANSPAPIGVVKETAAEKNSESG